jgi:hypothetical protein
MDEYVWLFCAAHVSRFTPNKQIYLAVNAEQKEEN